MRSTRTARSAVVIGLLLVGFALVAGPLLIIDDGPQSADVIIVIGGDHKPERIRWAAELYQQGYAPLIVISAGNQVLEGSEQVPEAEVMRRQALALGLPAAALLIEDQSLSTFQNAYYTRALAIQHDWDTLLLVTSAYQSRRAAHIFREVYGPDVSIWVQAAPPIPCRVCWWFQPDQGRVVLYEYYNWARYWLGIRLPSETPP